MITRSNVRLGVLITTSWPKLVFMLLYAAAFVVLCELGPDDVPIPLAVPTVLGTALSILLGFRTGAAYDRWWEARKLWGAIVNDSRTWARQVLTLLTASGGNEGGNEEALPALQRELIYRQIAWNYTLSHDLRGQDPLPTIEGLLPEEELAALVPPQNRHNAVLFTQGQGLKRARNAGYLDTLTLLPVEDTLRRFSDHMGKCERIKNTVFPTPYAYFINRAILIFYLLLPAGLVEHLQWMTVPVAFLVGVVFLLIETVSDYLQDPFENQISDTPMTAICRTIEIDLRQMLGETDLPEKLKPVDGVLM